MCGDPEKIAIVHQIFSRSASGLELPRSITEMVFLIALKSRRGEEPFGKLRGKPRGTPSLGGGFPSNKTQSRSELIPEPNPNLTAPPQLPDANHRERERERERENRATEKQARLKQKTGRTTVQVALRALLCASCPLQVDLCKLLCASRSAPVASCKLPCARLAQCAALLLRF